MSAWSDWKCGAITDEQYASAVRREQSKCDDCIFEYKSECCYKGDFKPCEGCVQE